jgi:putative peptide zinc metalloprotease protein
VTVDTDGGFVLEDPSKAQFYRVGPAEFRVLSYLDGHTSLAKAAQRAAQGSTGPAVAPSQLEALAQWLHGTQLVAAGDVPAPSGPVPAAPVNPCYVRIPLTKAGPLLTQLTAACGWLFSRPAMMAVAALTLVAAFHIAAHWSAFASSVQRVFYPDQHLVLAVCWLALKLLHELGHGVACRRLGGEVREFGVAMIFFCPVPYTDVTASWRCSRWQRMAIAAAGMYVEWIVALLAVALWSWTGSAAVRHVCVYVVTLATVTTVAFNANPLCRMDGYYLLSDWVGRPNLASQAQRIAQSWLAWLLVGQPLAPAEMPRGRYLATGLYGVASKLWRTLSLVTMAVLVILVYEGLGILLVLGIALAWQLQSARSRGAAAPKTRSLFTRAMALRVAAAALLLAALWWLVPWPGGIAAPGTIENVERHVIRAPCAGQVTEILVKNGQRIAPGQEIARLRNDELALELAELELAYAQGEIKLRSQRTKKQLVDWQVEERRQQTLAERIADCRQQLAELTLRSPAEGRVMARRLADLPGSYVDEGAEICSIAGDELECRILVAERNVPQFAAHLGGRISISLPGRRTAGVLTALEPHATASVADTNLGAHAGGPLAVAPAETAPDANHEKSVPWKLVEPRIVGHVRLSGTAETTLLAGQRGTARIRPAHYTVGLWLMTKVNTWLRQLTIQSQQRTAT